jgi:hypothetical protein
MNLSFEEIAVYLRHGAEIGDELRHRTLALAAEAPLEPRGVFIRDGGRFLLCGTVGSAFDRWHRGLSAASAADALIAQAIGTAAVEKTMDGIEAEIRSTLAGGETLEPRRSPGYGRMELALNREIVERLDAARRIGVSYTDAMTLSPAKSVTAVCRVRPRPAHRPCP